jgi:deoxyribodipyrimidine photolyase-related protein
VTLGRRWLFADQLGPHFLDDPDQPVLLVESRAVLRRRRFHRQKAHLMLSALRHRAAELGKQCQFVQSDTYGDARDEIREPVSLCRPRPGRRPVSSPPSPDVEVLPARGFATCQGHFGRWADGRGRARLLLEDFCRDSCRRLGLLMDGAEPAG